MDRLGEWDLDSYARTLINPLASGKEWETIDSSARQSLILILTKTGTMKVQAGRVILEYWPLLQNRDIQPQVRADCMLFLCRSKGDGRKWRIRFTGGVSTSEDQCASCFRFICSFLEPSATPFPVAPPPSVPPAAPPSASPQLPTLSLSSVLVTTQSLVPATRREHNLVSSGVTATAAPDTEPGSSASDGTTITPHQDAGVVAKTSGGGGGVSCSYATPLASVPTGGGDLNKALASIGDVPDLEQMVRLVLQDPKLPDLVDAVHKVIAEM
ncbi:vasodilator-stimulated phosphoprotein-like isoform X2 [Penaeus japonicus]|uniref:vasodilator-stimulated phosphoprotein-like isoform X2 n=1 Tax=Penaeus japonicus TaxID=27405 RepID=UPI001C712B9C|nr:vasodilator-stimulated phosphoprotein-like isoform X2 [Penaeus japonicus]